MPLPSLAAAVLLTLFAAPAGLLNRPPEKTAPLAPTQVRAQVDAYLDSIDTPITPEQWRALGPEGARALESAAQDQKRLPTRRARAVSALAVVGSPHASKVVVALARRESEKPVVRMSALQAAGQLLSPADLMATVKPVLETAKDPHVRATAAAVLVKRTPQDGCALVRGHAAREREELRPSFERALAACPLP
jgi:hypothetical protein